MAADYYALLGVSSTATQAEIKRAYRKLALELHPDARPDDPAAEARFKEVAQAYETLSDPERRRRYDTFGPEGAAGGGAGFDPFGAGGLGDIFESFFGGQGPFGGGGGRRGPSGPPRGADMELALELEFEEAVFGCVKEVVLRLPVPCATCEGSGAKAGTSPTTCTECAGAGQVRRVRQSILGQVVTAGPCPRCGGLGEVVADPCNDCRGDGRVTDERTYSVEVRAGVDDGNTLRLSGRGAAGPRGGGPGDLYVHLRVRPHERFGRDGFDLVDEMPVAMTTAALGAHLSYETLDGTEEIELSPGTQSGTVLRLRGRGVPRVDGRGRGDLVVHVVVETPVGLDEPQEELLRQLATARGEEVAPPGSGLFSRIRSAFK